MKDNDKFLKPGTGKPVPMPYKPGKGDEKPGAFVKPMPVRPGKPKPVAPRPVGNSGAMTKPAIKPPQIAAIEAMRKKQASR